MLSHFSRAQLFATPWTAAHQAPLSMGFSRPRILKLVAMPSSRGSSPPRDQTWVSFMSPALVGRLFTTSAPWEALIYTHLWMGFPNSSVGKEFACDSGDPVSISGSGRCWKRDRLPTPVFLGFPCGSAGKESACHVGSLGWEGPWRRESLPTPVFWPGEFHEL